ncbi:uncharacterized protein [Nicotiana sylvestris]|uniref:uncharacterized protein n=1 Tax=Nicotiana sylvestris TaxID=4096 RepID=UPI00388C5C83
MIEIEDEWDPEGSIGLIAEGDDPKKPTITLNPIIVQIQPSEDAEVNMHVPLGFEAAQSAKTLAPIEVEFVSPANAPAPFKVAVLPPKAHIIKKVENFENRLKSNLDETEIVNLGDAENVKETQISVHLPPSEKKEYTEFIKEYEDIFPWSYDDMTGLSTSIVAHKLPTYPTCSPVKQKLRKFKHDMSLKIKEEVTKQVKAKVLRVVEYPKWLANIVPVLKKDGKVKVCVDYQDLNRDSPKDDFRLPNIHILIDNCAKHELQSFVDCFAGSSDLRKRC